jgi:hypothetical protein
MITILSKVYLIGPALAISICAGLTIPAAAHEQWFNGVPVPGWVKSGCCGREEAHHLEPWRVHAMPDGWHIDGYHQAIAYGREFRSEDGEYWIFSRDYEDGPLVLCFFAPEQNH